jgi:hypothetical protein
MKLKPKKFELFQLKVDFLGRTVSKQGVELEFRGIKAVADWAVTTSVKEVEQFCGLANYNRMFIQDFARMAVPCNKSRQEGNILLRYGATKGF